MKKNEFINIIRTEIKQFIKENYDESGDDLGSFGGEFDKFDFHTTAKDAAKKDIEASGSDFEDIGTGEFEKGNTEKDFAEKVAQANLGLPSDEKELDKIKTGMEDKANSEKELKDVSTKYGFDAPFSLNEMKRKQVLAGIICEDFYDMDLTHKQYLQARELGIDSGRLDDFADYYKNNKTPEDVKDLYDSQGKNGKYYANVYQKFIDIIIKKGEGSVSDYTDSDSVGSPNSSLNEVKRKQLLAGIICENFDQDDNLQKLAGNPKDNGVVEDPTEAQGIMENETEESGDGLEFKIDEEYFGTK